MYHAKVFHSALVGTRLVDVDCERCGCAYAYELARVGSGQASAPYGIAAGRAERKAAEEAQRELARRLAEEAELVPCPQCQWVSESLIQGYRRLRCRNWRRIAAGFAIIGTAVAALGAWFMVNGAIRDRDLGIFCTVIVPAATGVVSVSLLVIQWLVRMRIQPNRDYPLPPRIPAGSPVALVRNPATGALDPATSPSPLPDTEGEGLGAWMDFQVGRIAFPDLCCQCLGASTPGANYQRALAPAVVLNIPMCAACARQWRRRKWWGGVVALALVAVFVLPSLWLLVRDEDYFWISLFTAAIVAPFAGATVADRLKAPVRIKQIDTARGVVRLWFRNERFASQAAAAEAERIG